VASPWTSTSYVALAASSALADRASPSVREQVEHYTDAERVILADAYQALLRYGPLPYPSSPLVIHRFRDPRAGDAYALVLPTVVVGYQVLGDTIVVQAADIIRRQ
jgi:hypothetical protein